MGPMACLLGELLLPVTLRFVLPEALDVGRLVERMVLLLGKRSEPVVDERKLGDRSLEVLEDAGGRVKEPLSDPIRRICARQRRPLALKSINEIEVSLSFSVRTGQGQTARLTRRERRSASLSVFALADLFGRRWLSTVCWSSLIASPCSFSSQSTFANSLATAEELSSPLSICWARVVALTAIWS